MIPLNSGTGGRGQTCNSPRRSIASTSAIIRLMACTSGSAEVEKRGEVRLPFSTYHFIISGRARYSITLHARRCRSAGRFAGMASE